MTNRQLLQIKKRYIKEGYKKALVEAQSLRQQMGDEWYGKLYHQ